jgi:hypothetical protein
MTASLTDFEKQLIHTAFYRHVNMAPKEIEKLVGVVEEAPAPSAPAPVEAVEQPGGAIVPAVAQDEIEPAGLTEEQRIGRRLVRIKRKKKEELTDAEYALMREAVNYIRRHADRPPKHEEKMADWRAGLMMWGYNPDKAEKDAQKPPHDNVGKGPVIL